MWLGREKVEDFIDFWHSALIDSLWLTASGWTTPSQPRSSGVCMWADDGIQEKERVQETNKKKGMTWFNSAISLNKILKLLFFRGIITRGRGHLEWGECLPRSFQLWSGTKVIQRQQIQSICSWCWSWSSSVTKDITSTLGQSRERSSWPLALIEEKEREQVRLKKRKEKEKMKMKKKTFNPGCANCSN